MINEQFSSVTFSMRPSFIAKVMHNVSRQLADMHCQLADDKDLIIGTSARCLWSDAPMCPCHLKRHCNHLICWGDWKCECETVENAILENARHENDKAGKANARNENNASKAVMGSQMYKFGSLYVSYVW